MEVDVVAALVGATVGGVSGGIVAVIGNHFLEKYRSGEGYRKVVYEKVVNAISSVHEVYTKHRSRYENCLGPYEVDRRDKVELRNSLADLWTALSEHSLYYPRDLKRTILNAGKYYCLLGTDDYDWNKGEELHHKYLEKASEKIDFKGTELLKLGYTGKDDEEISLPYDEDFI